MKKYRINVNGSLYEVEIEEMSAPATMSAPAAPAAPSFVPEDIDTPVAASRQPSKPTDMSEIDEIFSIFKR